jgi:hypothetical protein
MHSVPNPKSVSGEGSIPSQDFSAPAPSPAVTTMKDEYKDPEIAPASSEVRPPAKFEGRPVIRRPQELRLQNA